MRFGKLLLVCAIASMVAGQVRAQGAAPSQGAPAKPAPAVSSAESAAVDTGADILRLLRFVPTDWPVLVRMDATRDTASGAFLQKVHSSSEWSEMTEMQKSFEQGFGKLLNALGIEIGWENGLLPWMGDRMVMALDPRPLLPGGQAQQMVPPHLVAFSVSDRKAALEDLERAFGSVVRNEDPERITVGGAEIHIWRIDLSPLGVQEKIPAAYAVGDGFGILADSVDRLTQLLQAPSGGTPRAAGALALHKDDLIAFSIDIAAIVGPLMGGSASMSGGSSSLAALDAADESSPANVARTVQTGEGSSLLSILLSSAGPVHGGLRVDDAGYMMTVESEINPFAQMGLRAMLQMGAAPARPLATYLPSSSMAYISSASGSLYSQMLQQLPAQMGDLRKFAPDAEAAVTLLGLAPKAAQAVAMTGIVPRPNYVTMVSAANGAEAAGILRHFRQALQEQGIRVSANPRATAAMVFELVRGDNNKLVGFAAQTGNNVFFASDWRSAQRVMATTPQTSLATRKGFSEVQNLIQGPGALDMWVSLEGVSALGFLYEAMDAGAMATTRSLAESLKGTNGFGMSAGFTESGVGIKMALNTTITPGSPSILLSSALTAAASLAVFAGETSTITLGDARESALAAQSNASLKALAGFTLMYVDEHGTFPNADTWQADLQPYAGGPLPESAFDGYIFRYNPALSGVEPGDIVSPGDLVVFAEVPAGQPFEAFRGATNPSGTTLLAFADWSVWQARPARVRRAVTEPGESAPPRKKRNAPDDAPEPASAQAM